MNALSRLLVPASILCLFVWLFAEALFNSGMFVFRDAGHYYYPLFRLIADEWAAGRVPLWNPYENLGQPLLGNPTAGVFYPGKLIFALPLDFAWAYKFYIMGHVLLAAWAAYRLARHFGASVEAAGVCALSYAFSGNVLFQYCNLIFLVGAAWLPLAMLAMDRTLRESSFRWAVAFGVVLALMVLGGDPQMAYNAGLLAVMFALWLWSAESPLSLWERVRVRGKRHSPHPGPLPKGEGVWKSRPVLLALAAGVGLALSAIQVLPSIELARHSNRGSAYSAEMLLGKATPDTHADHAYQFSVGPWRLTEYVWPNVGGRQFPVHRRWLEVIPAEGRVWTPSLYMGLLPLLLALAAMRLRRGEPRDRWLSWSVVLAVVAGFGWYGLGWLVGEVRVAAGGDPASPELVGAPFGGLYWLMRVLLPGYAYFRYPAKLLLVAALGLSVLAARGFDRTFAEPSPRFRRVLLWLGTLSGCGAIAALAIRPFWHRWLSSVEPDMLFGPLDTSAAANDLLQAFTQTAVLSALFWCLLKQRCQEPFLSLGEGKKVPDTFLSAALVLVAVDLGVANGWMVVCAPASGWEQPSKLAAALQREEARGDGQPYRVFRHPIWTPAAWKSSGSLTRLDESMAWDRDTLWPKYNLLSRVCVVDVHGAIRISDYDEFLRTAPNVSNRLAKYAILPGDEVLPSGRRIDVDVGDVSLWHNPQHLRRAWITEGLDDLSSGRKKTPDPFVLRCGPLGVEMEVELVRPGVVVLCDQFYPGWTLEVETAGEEPRVAAILRTNRVMRAVKLPAGRHRLIYRYRPMSFFCGAVLSGLGWFAVVLAVGWSLKGRRRCR